MTALATADDISKPSMKLAALLTRSDRKGFERLAIHIGILIVTGALVLLARDSWLILPAMALHGVAIICLFAPFHEGVHYTAFYTRGINEVVSWLSGAAILRDRTLYKHAHHAHHRFCQDPARDPELATAKPKSLGAYAWRLSGLPHIRDNLAAMVRVALGRFERMPYLPEAARQRVRRSVYGLFALYGALVVASAVTDPWLIVILWLAPVLLGMPFLRFILMAEHTDCPEIKDNFQNTRTTFTTWPIRLLMWNMPYHAEHHINPGIPFHALPAAHLLLHDRITHQTRGYIRFNVDYLRGLKTS
jgi:fatty acid desaturase